MHVFATRRDRLGSRLLQSSRMLNVVVIALFLLLLAPAPAWAYIDPGAGSYFFQILIASGLAGVYTLRRYLAPGAFVVLAP